MNSEATSRCAENCSARSCRTFALVDLDDFLGGGTNEALSELGSALGAMARASSVDVVFGSSDVTRLSAASDIWSGAHLVWRSQCAHVRQALVELVASETRGSYDHVVIASGSTSYAFVARSLRNDGVDVSVVAELGSVPKSVSKKIEFAVSKIEGFKNGQEAV